MYRPRLRLTWWQPDLALTAACVTLFYCLFLFQGYQQLFRDSDAGWHIRTGEAILATGALPQTDPYSFTRAGQPWFAWEWLVDVATGMIHSRLGLNGVALFYAAAISAGVWLWFRLHWALHGNFLIACAMAPLLLSTCNIHWLARPHVVSWLFLLCAVFPVVSRNAKHRSLIAVGIFSCLWANTHASFFLAPVIALVFAIQDRWYLKAALVAAVAPLLNPYTWRLYVHLFKYLTDSDLLSRIGEFQSFDFHAPGAGQIIATLILGMIGGTLALTHRRLHHFVLAVLITAMALRSARALPLAALLLLPIANSAITASAVPLAPLKGFLAYSANLRAMDARFSGVALVPLVLLAAFALLRHVPTGFPPDQFPVQAYAQIPAEARLFAPDKFGGYLIYRSNGTLKVFFDGRSDLYGAEFLKQYARLIQVRPGWWEYWESFHFTHALLPNDYGLVPALERAGWRRIYRDQTATLLAPGG
jgi:hypothetical protein